MSTLYYNWRSVVDRLGTVSDNEIAKELGCTLQAVRYQRVKRGIPPSEPKAAFVDWDLWGSKLGTMPDAALAREIGCSYRTVVGHRIKHGIKPYDRRGGANKSDLTKLARAVRKKHGRIQHNGI